MLSFLFMFVPHKSFLSMSRFYNNLQEYDAQGHKGDPFGQSADSHGNRHPVGFHTFPLLVLTHFLRSKMSATVLAEMLEKMRVRWISP